MSLVDEFAEFVGSVPYREVGKSQVWDLGEGPPIVLLHGIAAGRRVFFRAAPLLARRWRVVVPSLLGEDVPAPRATWPELLDDLAGLLDALELDGVTLLGSSFGGTIALRYGARRDPRVKRIVVQGTFARFSLRPFDRVMQALSSLLPARVGSAYFARRVRLGPENALLAEDAPGMERLMPAWSAKTPFATLRRRVKLITSMDLEAEMKRIDVPLTIARGDKDRVVPRFFFEQLAAARPDARHVEWKGVGHNVALTRPDLLAELAGVGEDDPVDA